MNTNTQDPIASWTLADLLKARGTLSQKQALSLLQPVIASLTRMHSQGLVHGHISPETIFLRNSSFLLFCSPLPENYKKHLGKSLSHGEKERLGFTASLGNTDASQATVERFDAYRASETYMSSRFVTPAADVYSLCAVIYTAVTGRMPESAESILFKPEAKPVCDILALALQEKDLKNCQISVKLMQILKKGMSLFPKDRYADAGQLNALLENQDAKRRPQLDAKFIDALAYKVKDRYPCFHRAYIESITFLDTLENRPPDYVVLSKDDNGMIFAWVRLSASEKYNVFIAADGGISAASDISRVFEECTALKTIDFGNLDTSNITDMDDIFLGCDNLNPDIKKKFTVNAPN
ncbi:MAG TPA: BspA family leucine-rich repeat surface protein [Candidatus Scybalocola faecipullorum]|nr:BspA family leucine-rich repeat surface protein [Candidatus Scybalocola faecipullorum]